MMQKFVLSTKFLMILMAVILTSSVSRSETFIGQLQAMSKVGDDLGIRILLRKNFKKKMSIKDWNEARKIIVKRPGVGFDVVAAWDRQASFRGSNLEKEADKFTKFVDDADELALNKDFVKSFEKYQQAAKFLKKSNKNKIPKGNELLYLNLLHQMARSLYAQKRFTESLEVYDWISPSYPQVRQVLYEKMWAAFRANKFDMALGAIASQQSGYFSEYLNPESYLIKIYIFKRLCRKNDLAYTIKSIRTYLNALKSNKMNEIEWARTDLFYLSLAKLTDSNLLPDEKKRLDVVSVAERNEEIKKIKSTLTSKFQVNKVALQNQLERVLGYAALAASDEQDFLKPITSLPPAQVLESRGYELWPAKGAEEWLDEIGNHVFVGDSECKSIVK